MALPFPLLKAGSGNDFQVVPKALPTTFATTEKPRVFLTTVRIPDDHIWANGLFQNVYVIYKMLDAMGLEPWLLVDNNENNKDAKLHTSFRLTDFKTYIQNPFRIVSYIEMGMSCDPSIRKFFRSMGAKTSKLYLGNILNIDIETITYYHGVNFSHHVAGELDEIWTSPHYDLHADYTGSINGMCGKTRIAPYVWDPMFIAELGHVYDATGLISESPRKFIIMEPNISFQKNALIPILALEAYYRDHSGRIDQIVAINGQKFKDNAYFTASIAPSLLLLKHNKLQLMPRAHMINAARVFKDAIIVQHQVNNEYNYSFLEWITMGFPVVHNVSRFKDFGYYYEGNDFMAAKKQIEQIVEHHEKNKESYKAHATQLTWRFSPYNPENITAWKSLVLEK
jgi:hypothetical protein